MHLVCCKQWLGYLLGAHTVPGKKTPKGNFAWIYQFPVPDNGWQETQLEGTFQDSLNQIFGEKKSSAEFSGDLFGFG
jgi:hypothetical protein